MPYILMIRERRYSWGGRGPIAMTFPTEEAAKAELLDYVRENWHWDDPPEDEDDLIEEYFDGVHEEYDIAEIA